MFVGAEGMAGENAGGNGGDDAAGDAPVATGLILLKLFGRRQGFGGRLFENFGVEFIFTWKAVDTALAVMVFPLPIRSLRTAFE